MTAPCFKKIIYALILFFCTALAVESQDYTQPVLKSCIPSQIEVTQEGGEILLYLMGEHFLIWDQSSSQGIWNAREIILYVRHSAKGGNWQSLYNSRRNIKYGSGYPNPPRSFGQCAYDWDYQMRVWLPRNIWCNTEGTLEFLVVKTRWGDDGKFHEIVRSSILGVPVKRSVTSITEIYSLFPEYFAVDKTNPVTHLYVKGKFDFGTAVLIDNIECKTVGSNPLEGVIMVELPPGMLKVQALHSVRLRDSQGTPCMPKTFWVYGPPKVTKVDPNRLRVGMGGIYVKIRYGGLKPKKVLAKVEYVIRTKPSGSQNVVSGKTPVKTWNKGGTGAGQTQTPPSSWESVAFDSSKRERLTITLESKWTVFEGMLKMRLVSDAGNTDVKIPIKKPKPAVKYKPPKLIIKKPLKLQTHLLNTKHKKRIIELARMIVELKPGPLVKTKASNIYKAYKSDTKGSPQKTDENFLNALKKEVQKEIWNTEKQKDKQMTQQQRKHIQRLIQMIKQMIRK